MRKIVELSANIKLTEKNYYIAERVLDSSFNKYNGVISEKLLVEFIFNMGCEYIESLTKEDLGKKL